MGGIISGVLLGSEEINYYNNSNIIVLTYTNYFSIRIGLALWFRQWSLND